MRKGNCQYTVPNGHMLVLRTCASGGSSRNGFRYPLVVGERVECPDWSTTPECGGGLHGLPWGIGDHTFMDLSDSAVGQVYEVAESDWVQIGGSKGKFRCGVLRFSGRLDDAAVWLNDHQPQKDRAGYRGSATAGAYGSATAGAYGSATAGAYGSATAGYRGSATAGAYGSATAGYRGSATAGDGGSATAGDGGSATAGDGGSATAGYRGSATAGDGGCLAILHWNGKRYKMRVATVKDEDGDGDLEPNVRYQLNAKGEFVRVEEAAK